MPAWPPASSCSRPPGRRAADRAQFGRPAVWDGVDRRHFPRIRALMDASELDLDAARAAIGAARSGDDLAELRKRYVGKGSVAARARESIKDLPNEERPAL